MLPQVAAILALVSAAAVAAPTPAPAPHPQDWMLPYFTPAKCKAFYALAGKDLQPAEFDGIAKEFPMSGNSTTDAQVCWDFARTSNHYGAVMTVGQSGNFRCMTKNLPSVTEVIDYSSYLGVTNPPYNLKGLKELGAYTIPGYEVAEITGAMGFLDKVEAAKCDMVYLDQTDNMDTFVRTTVGHCKQFLHNKEATLILGEDCLSME